MKTKEADLPAAAKRIIFTNRIKSIESVQAPMILISQVQRSGGTLLSQLFDNHPELMAHPSELYIGKPTKYFWPRLNLKASSDDLFASLREPIAEVHAYKGYEKNSTAGTKTVEQVFHPFIFLQDLQAEIFINLLKGFPAASQRQVLNCYVASYFGAWLDYQGAYRPRKQIRYWTAFAPRLMSDKENRQLFFLDYPDGYWIAILRDPVSWYASAAQHQPSEYGDIDKAIKIWQQSYEAVLDEQERNADRIIVLMFEDLVKSPTALMKKLAAKLSINFDEALLRPTFNSIPILADSSFEVSKHGILMEAADRSEFIQRADIERIRENTSGLYGKIAALRLA